MFDTNNNDTANDTSLTNTSSAVDFFAPVFEPTLHRVVFVLTTILVETVGNLLLYLLQAYVSSEANAILCDRLVATLVRLWLFCNVAVHPFKVCWHDLKEYL